jgi:prophage regulatory protein
MTQSASLLRIEDVMRRVGFRRNKLYDLINAGDFPDPVKLGRISAWVESEVVGWIDAQIAKRDEARPQRAKAPRSAEPVIALAE